MIAAGWCAFPRPDLHFADSAVAFTTPTPIPFQSIFCSPLVSSSASDQTLDDDKRLSDAEDDDGEDNWGLVRDMLEVLDSAASQSTAPVSAVPSVNVSQRGELNALAIELFP